MLGGHFIGAVHAPPLFPGSSTPCSPTGWSNPAARPACTRPILAAYSAGTALVPGRSTLPAKPSCRATQIAPIHDHGESCPRALPGADSHTPPPSRSPDPNSSPAEVHHRFFFRRASARSMDRGLIETPKRCLIASDTFFSVGEAARHCSTKSRTSSVHL